MIYIRSPDLSSGKQKYPFKGFILNLKINTLEVK